jgi:hypothetical protein
VRSVESIGARMEPAELAREAARFHARLYDALYALDPDTLDGRARIEEL